MWLTSREITSRRRLRFPPPPRSSPSPTRPMAPSRDNRISNVSVPMGEWRRETARIASDSTVFLRKHDTSHEISLFPLSQGTARSCVTTSDVTYCSTRLAALINCKCHKKIKGNSTQFLAVLACAIDFTSCGLFWLSLSGNPSARIFLITIELFWSFVFWLGDWSLEIQSLTFL